MGFDRALALAASGLLDRHGASGLLRNTACALVGQRLPDVQVDPGRLYDRMGRRGLLLVREGEDELARAAHDLGDLLDVPTAALPASLDRFGFVGTMAVYVRPNHVIVVQFGRGDIVGRAAVCAAWGGGRTSPVQPASSRRVQGRPVCPECSRGARDERRQVNRTSRLWLGSSKGFTSGPSYPPLPARDRGTRRSRDLALPQVSVRPVAPS